MRLDDLYRVLTGISDTTMLRVMKECKTRTGENSFSRLNCLRHAFSAWSFMGGHVFLFPFGPNIFRLSKDEVHIKNPLFSIHFYR